MKTPLVLAIAAFWSVVALAVDAPVSAPPSLYSIFEQSHHPTDEELHLDRQRHCAVVSTNGALSFVRNYKFQRAADGRYVSAPDLDRANGFESRFESFRSNGNDLETVGQPTSKFWSASLDRFDSATDYQYRTYFRANAQGELIGKINFPQTHGFREFVFGVDDPTSHEVLSGFVLCPAVTN